MKYALNLSEENRILSACVVLPNGNYGGMPIVETIPEGNLPNYLYINGKFVYDPLPEPEPVEPSEAGSVWDELDAAYQEGVDSV